MIQVPRPLCDVSYSHVSAVSCTCTGASSPLTPAVWGHWGQGVGVGALPSAPLPDGSGTSAPVVARVVDTPAMCELAEGFGSHSQPVSVCRCGCVGTGCVSISRDTFTPLPFLP